MRSISRLFLAPLPIVAAVLLAGAPAHAAISAPMHHGAIAEVICPAGTNWNTVLQRCV
jgi:hypothetical protein